MSTGVLALVLAGSFASRAIADDRPGAVTAAAGGACVITVTRTACPGKDKESFSKCNGKQRCELTSSAATAEDCAAAALKECEVVRPLVTKSKAVTATFGGKPVENGKNFCAADRPDFNKCTK